MELLALLFGVVLLSFLLFEFNPEATYSQLGKHSATSDVAEVRRQLGYDDPAMVRFGRFVKSVITLDFGRSWSTGESVDALLGKSIPVSLLMVLPGFLLGNLLALAIAVLALTRSGRWLDQLVNGVSVVIMSISFVVLMIAVQLLLATDFGVPWLPTRGWAADSFGNYLRYATLPSVVLMVAALGYNLRFFRGVLVGELGQPYVETARLFGASERTVLVRHVLPNALAPIITRLAFSLPVICVSGSLLLESYFGIPGVGLVTYNAIQSSDVPVLQALVVMAGCLFALVANLTDFGYRLIGSRQTGAT